MIDAQPPGTFTQTVAHLVDQLLRNAKAWLAIAGGLLLIALQISWLQEPLKAIGIVNKTPLETSVVLVLLLAILLEIRELARLARVVPTPRQHFPDPNEMYQALLIQLDEIARADERKLDVLGLTLYSAWPQISFWLQKPKVTGWKIRFAAIDPTATGIERWISKSWPAEAAASLQSVRGFADLPIVSEQHNTLEIFEYDFVPCVHGFRLGNGDIFISTLLWQGDRRLGQSGFSYDYVHANERGSGAIAMRNLFDNWFDRAIKPCRPSAIRDESSSP